MGAVQLDVCLTSKLNEGLVTLVIKVIAARNLGEKEIENLYPYVVCFIFYIYNGRKKKKKGSYLIVT